MMAITFCGYNLMNCQLKKKKALLETEIFLFSNEAVRIDKLLMLHF